MSLPTVSPRDINVLVTGLGPFGQWRHNAGWSAICPLHDTYLDPWSPPLMRDDGVAASPQGAHAGSSLPRIHIQTLQIPMHYPAVLDLIPRLHGHEPLSPYASPWLDPKGAQDRFAGDGRAYPAGYAVRHPVDGWDVILHVGVGKAGKMTIETTARKAGYKGRDTDGNFPPPLPTGNTDGSSSSASSSTSSLSAASTPYSSLSVSGRQRSLWSASSDGSSRGSFTTVGSLSPELGARSSPADSDPPNLFLPPSTSQNDSDRQLRKRLAPKVRPGESRLALPRVGDKADLEKQSRPLDEDEDLTETQRARKRLRSYKKFLERHPRGIAFERPFLEKRPAGGFDEGYEDFGDVEVADLDTDLLVEWLTQMNHRDVFQSRDGGGWLCEFILYCSLCESRRPNAFLGRASQVIDGSTWGEQADQGAKVLFIHCPPVGEPLSVKEIRAAVRATVWWVCTRDRTRGTTILDALQHRLTLR
ncbi:hypothetical protein V8E36_001335 [Tilletia maclaganii]